MTIQVEILGIKGLGLDTEADSLPLCLPFTFLIIPYRAYYCLLVLSGFSEEPNDSITLFDT